MHFLRRRQYRLFAVQILHLGGLETDAKGSDCPVGDEALQASIL
jgi:hypothetical protein